jgi:Family of unknown function (DUF5696)
MQKDLTHWTWRIALAASLATAPWAAEPGAATLQTPFLRFDVAPENGGFEIQDAAGGVTWQSNPYHARFGEVTFRFGGKQRHADLGQCQIRISIDALMNTDPQRVQDILQSLFPRARGLGGQMPPGELPGGVEESLELTFHPVQEDPAAWLRVRVRRDTDEKSLTFSYEAAESLEVESVRLLDDALWVTDSDKGYLAVPVREGMLIPADSGLQFTHRFDTYAYEGCHMEMLGVVKRGAAALLTWDDPYVAADVRGVCTNAVWAHGGQVLSPSLTLRKSARSFRLQFLGKGDYVTIAQAYRQVAKNKGWLVTWDQKLVGHPERAKLFGAINFKLWSTLDRRMNEASTEEERVRVNWTFDEAAQVAEHLKNDLKLDKVLFTMGGWIHRGYDNQHPDILPTAPECGGDAAFTDCARRVRQLGYLFCLHDNYQDIYRDSPSWNENLIMKNPDGSLMRGGHWAGGLAFLICSQEALGLAERPQNLPGVKKLSDANAYFIDTTYAAGLQECFDKNHPLTRRDDMKWKQALSDYARGVFGIFGSECGREWAIPHSDFFEGLTGVSGRYYHDANLLKSVGGVVVPLFEIVYRDCIAMYGKYGYNISQSAEYVLHHISIGRPLNYHNVPSHLYWKQSSRTNELPPATNPASDRGIFTRAHHGWAEGLNSFDRFVKNTAEILSPLNELTARSSLTEHRFLTPDRKVQRTVFGAGGDAVQVIVNDSGTEFRMPTDSPAGEVVLPPYGFLVNSRRFLAYLALECGGVRYETPALFTARSLDGQPLESSSRIRVFHGFGDPRIRLGAKTYTVDREAVLSED